MINKVRLLALPVLLLSLLAAFAPAASASTAMPAAKKAEASVTQTHFLAAAPLCGARPCRLIGTVFKDINYKGSAASMTAPDYGDCNVHTYTWSFGWGTIGRAGSSIARGAASPYCNAAIITTTYGGTVPVCLSKPNVGAAANDVIASVKIYMNLNCPRYWYY